MTEHQLFMSTSDLPSITAALPVPGAIVIRPNINQPPLVTIHPDGTLEYGPNYQPDEAARAFWDAMAARAQSMHTLYGPGLTERINEQLEARQRAEEQIEQVREWARERGLLDGRENALEDILAGPSTGTLTAQRKVKRLDAMAQAWKERLPDTIDKRTVVEAIHMVTRGDTI